MTWVSLLPGTKLWPEHSGRAQGASQQGQLFLISGGWKKPGCERGKIQGTCRLQGPISRNASCKVFLFVFKFTPKLHRATGNFWDTPRLPSDGTSSRGKRGSNTSQPRPRSKEQAKATATASDPNPQRAKLDSSERLRKNPKQRKKRCHFPTIIPPKKRLSRQEAPNSVGG